MSRLVWGLRQVGRFPRIQSLSIATRTASNLYPNLVGANLQEQWFGSKPSETTCANAAQSSRYWTGVGVSITAVGLVWTIYNTKQQLGILQDELTALGEWIIDSNGGSMDTRWRALEASVG